VAVRDVVRYPDPRLKQVCEPVGAGLGSAATQQLAADLLETMSSFPGCVGIAAPQIGTLIRIGGDDAVGQRE